MSSNDYAQVVPSTIPSSAQPLGIGSTQAASKSPSLSAKLISGSVGSMVTALALTPLDVVKVREQSQATCLSLRPTSISATGSICRGCGTFVINNGIMDCTLPRSAAPFFDVNGSLTETAARNNLARRGTFGMLRAILLREGLGGIYAGLGPTLVMSIPNTVLYFTSYDELSVRFRQRFGQTKNADVWIPLLCGSSSRLIASSATAPLELIRTRQASIVGSNQPKPSWIAEMRNLLREGGVASLFRGLSPTLWRDVPFSAIYWLGLEQLKLLWMANGFEPQTPAESGLQSFLNGALSGMVAAAVTTPFDVAKTRAMVDSNVHNSVLLDRKGTMQLILQITKEEGVEGLFRGASTRLIKVAPACAIMISCYEAGKSFLQ